MHLFIFFIGCTFGSFVYLATIRIPQKRSILLGRSTCDSCCRTLPWRELIPIFSYLYQQGKSTCCQKKLSLLYPLSECSAGFLACWLWNQRTTATFLLFTFWVCSAYLLALIDSQTYHIDPLLLFLSAIGLWSSWFRHQTIHWETTVLVVLFGLAVFTFASHYLGDGDCWLLLVWSGGLSLEQIFLLLFFASFSGLVWFYLCQIVGQSLTKIPFVPFLSLGLILVLSL